MSLNSVIPSTGITCANPKQRVPVGGGDSTHPSSLHIPFWQPTRKATRGNAFFEEGVTGDHKQMIIPSYMAYSLSSYPLYLLAFLKHCFPCDHSILVIPSLPSVFFSILELSLYTTTIIQVQYAFPIYLPTLCLILQAISIIIILNYPAIE